MGEYAKRLHRKMASKAHNLQAEEPKWRPGAVGVAVEVLDIIAERRQKLFPDLRKIIVDYEVEICGGRLTLNVSSAPTASALPSFSLRNR